MKRLFLLLILGTYFLVSCNSPEIASSAKGGDWNDSKTWLNGKVPSTDSDVIISGNVFVNGAIECNNLKILKEGTLEFSQTQDSLKAKVSGNIVINDGKMIIGEKWNVFTNDINLSDSAKIKNYGILTVGQ
jgi:hypothetical protein